MHNCYGVIKIIVKLFFLVSKYPIVPEVRKVKGTVFIQVQVALLKLNMSRDKMANVNYAVGSPRGHQGVWLTKVGAAHL